LVSERLAKVINVNHIMLVSVQLYSVERKITCWTNLHISKLYANVKKAILMS